MHIALGRAERAGWLVGLCLGIHRLMKMPRSIGYPGKRGWTYDDPDGTFGYTYEKSAEIPRSTRVSVRSLMRLGIRYMVRLFVQYENLPRSMNCEMQARNQLFSGICKQWKELWSYQLEGFNTTVIGP